MSLEMLKAVLKGKSAVIYLDDLCKWLETHALKAPYIITDPGKAITAEAWKELLTKWMEEQDEQKKRIINDGTKYLLQQILL